MSENILTDWLSERYPSVSPIEFYREVFPLSELDNLNAFTKGKYCGIAIQVHNNKAKRYSITNDLEVINELISTDDFIIISPVSYAGKSQKQENARFLYALAFDLDGIYTKEDGTPQGVIDLFYQMSNELLPTPTYTVSSGSGLHLYYLFEKPIPLFRNVLQQLWVMKKFLTANFWNRYVTTLYDNPQYESVTQSFRAVGSITKDKTQRVQAFLTGERVTIEELNEFCDKESQVSSFSYKSDLTLNAAKILYPDWYKNRIEQGRPRGIWNIKSDLYEWWLKKLRDKTSVRVGHRYFCIMALAAYAIKCGIERDRLEKDALSLVDDFDEKSIDNKNKFTSEDVMKALEVFNISYVTFPREAIEKLTAIPMPANKRNYQKQIFHLEEARVIRDIRQRRNGSNWWDNGNRDGAPKKRDLIRKYAYEHPEENHSQIARALGVSRSTVIKWLKNGWREEYEEYLKEEDKPKTVNVDE